MRGRWHVCYGSGLSVIITCSIQAVGAFYVAFEISIYTVLGNNSTVESILIC